MWRSHFARTCASPSAEPARSRSNMESHCLPVASSVGRAAPAGRRYAMPFRTRLCGCRRTRADCLLFSAEKSSQPITRPVSTSMRATHGDALWCRSGRMLAQSSPSTISSSLSPSISPPSRRGSATRNGVRVAFQPFAGSSTWTWYEPSVAYATFRRSSYARPQPSPRNGCGIELRSASVATSYSCMIPSRHVSWKSDRPTSVRPSPKCSPLLALRLSERPVATSTRRTCDRR
mmetsp:Transcript_5543/g.17205  ORF Transcript_5543/g.17205 Transcript_5543/m.17205 type:complete len:233 (-) Transcript_5543:121-819(-)